MQAGCFELVTDESEAEQPAAESVCGVVGGGPGGRGTFLSDSLVAHSQTELYVSFDFAGVEG